MVGVRGGESSRPRQGAGSLTNDRLASRIERQDLTDVIVASGDHFWDLAERGFLFHCVKTALCGPWSKPVSISPRSPGSTVHCPAIGLALARGQEVRISPHSYPRGPTHRFPVTEVGPCEPARYAEALYIPTSNHCRRADAADSPEKSLVQVRRPLLASAPHPQILRRECWRTALPAPQLVRPNSFEPSFGRT